MKHDHNPSLLARFERKYIPVTESGCWLWERSLASKGYGTISFNGIELKAHRISWELHRGKIPPGLHVLHRCDVTCCVNPNHLFLGTDKDNKVDAMSKERHARGTSHGRSKLSEDQVRSIRNLYNNGASQVELGKKYGVSSHTVSCIVRNVIWKSIH